MVIAKIINITFSMNGIAFHITPARPTINPNKRIVSIKVLAK